MQLCCSQLFLVTCSIRIFIFRVGKSGKDSSHCSSRRTAATPSSSTADPFAGNDSANRTVRRAARHGGGVKLLLRCLQSIQCQYYLVFGVVKTVPLQSFARLRVPFRPCPLTLSFPTSLPVPRHHSIIIIIIFIITSLRHNGSTTTWRTVIDTYTYCIYSVYVVSLLLIPRMHASTRACVRAFRPHPPRLSSSSLLPQSSLIRGSE